MKIGAPWRIKRINGDVRNAAKLAARRSGIAVMEKLSVLIGRHEESQGINVRTPRHDDDRDADVLTSALKRLTHRIRAMDKSTRAGLSDLNQRLDEIAGRLSVAAGAYGGRRRARSLKDIVTSVEELTRDIDNTDEEARSTVEGLRFGIGERAPNSDVNRLAEAVRLLEARLTVAPGSGVAQQSDRSPADLEAIKTRLDALLAETPETAPTGHTRFDAAVGSLDAKVDATQSRLAAIESGIASLRQAFESAESPRTTTGLETRTAEFEARSAALFERLDALRSAYLPSAALLDEFKAGFAEIRREISERDSSQIARIERLIGGLAQRLDADGHSDQATDALKALEGRIAELTSQFEQAAPPATFVKDIEARLERLQGLLADNRHQSSEAARTAAPEAARQMAEVASGGEIVRALKRDLESFRATTSTADRRTHEYLATVQRSLAQVVEQVTRLEIREDATPAVVGEPRKATGTYGAGTPVTRVDAGVPVGGRFEMARVPTADGGSDSRVARPDLAALRELTRSSAHGPHDPPTDRKADFIAAARRAMQVATEDTLSQSGEAAGEAKSGTFARIGQAIRSRRRSLLVAAALPLAISALYTVFAHPDATHKTPSAVVDTLTGAAEARAKAVGAPSSPPIGGSVLKASLSDDMAAFAFAAPGRVDNRFGDAPDIPPTGDFVRSSGPAASLPLDEAIGAVPLREAAVSGDSDAAVEVAARYAKGRRVPRDLAKAAAWYALAAENGVAVAQYRLASLYERGQGVAKDPVTAAAWYKRAAEQGNTGAMHNLAVMLSDGIEGTPNYAKAAGWFLAAANHGIVDSQYNLGVFYARGLGLDQNLVESYKWFALAAAAGDLEAAARRDEIGDVLTSDELAKARTAAKAWQAAPAYAGANAVAVLPEAWTGAHEGITEADRRSLVMKIQTLLTDQGYNPGPADGLDGPKTRRAVEAFQRSMGLAETGTVSRDLVAALVEPSG